MVTTRSCAFVFHNIELSWFCAPTIWIIKVNTELRLLINTFVQPIGIHVCLSTAHTVLQFSTPALLILRTLGAWDLVSGTRLLRNVFLRIIHCEKHLGHSTHFLQALCMSKTAKWTLQFHRIKIQFKCLTILLNSWTINWRRGAQFGVETFTRTQKIKCLMLKM